MCLLNVRKLVYDCFNQKCNVMVEVEAKLNVITTSYIIMQIFAGSNCEPSEDVQQLSLKIFGYLLDENFNENLQVRVFLCIPNVTYYYTIAKDHRCQTRLCY